MRLCRYSTRGSELRIKLGQSGATMRGGATECLANQVQNASSISEACYQRMSMAEVISLLCGCQYEKGTKNVRWKMGVRKRTLLTNAKKASETKAQAAE